MVLNVEGSVEISGSLHCAEISIVSTEIRIKQQGLINASRISLTAKESLIIQNGTSVSAAGRGNATVAGPRTRENQSSCGGTHGGEGSTCCFTGPGTAYGMLDKPWTSGGDGEDALNCNQNQENCSKNESLWRLVPGGRGGGMILLKAGTSVQIDGIVSANGLSGSDGCTSGNCAGAGGGAGGSIQVIAPRIEGRGQVQANGGAGGSGPNKQSNSSWVVGEPGGAGGGGRISLEYNQSLTNLGSLALVLEAFGGPGKGQAGCLGAGSAGTVYMSPADGVGTIIMDNNFQASGPATLDHPNASFWLSPRRLIIRASASVRLPSNRRIQLSSLDVDARSSLYVGSPTSASTTTITVSSTVRIHGSLYPDGPTALQTTDAFSACYIDAKSALNITAQSMASPTCIIPMSNVTARYTTASLRRNSSWISADAVYVAARDFVVANVGPITVARALSVDCSRTVLVNGSTIQVRC
jgi:hypothetical protein